MLPPWGALWALWCFCGFSHHSLPATSQALPALPYIILELMSIGELSREEARDRTTPQEAKLTR